MTHLASKILASVWLFCSLVPGAGAQTATSASKAASSSETRILAHYMPWYQTPSGHGFWGWHWTMNHFDPDHPDGGGFPEIASHFRPLTGPYDSSDPDILEYQTLLMKLSGIDGVIVDWYGIEDFWDYGLINESTHALFGAIEKAGLEFAVMYEDQTIGHMRDNGHLGFGSEIEHGRTVMRYLQDNWFEKDAYVKIGERPVLFNFGPQFFTSDGDWNQLFSTLSAPPLFFILGRPPVSPASGAFFWPPMFESINGVLSRSALLLYLENFAHESSNWDHVVPSAFPGFLDIYSQAFVGPSFGFLDASDGETFQLTLDAAFDLDTDIVQLVTWNDYGEGTIIEPTAEFGYRYLEMVQNQRRLSIDPAFPRSAGDLTLPIRLFNLRKNNPNNTDVNLAMDGVFESLISGDMEAAIAVLEFWEFALATPVEIAEGPIEFIMGEFYPNPFRTSTSIQFTAPRPVSINLSIFDLTGRKVAILASGFTNQGSYSVTWDGADLPSGAYLGRLVAAGQVTTKMVFISR